MTTKFQGFGQVLIVLMTLLQLAACGGGGGGDAPPPNTGTSGVRILGLAQVDEGSNGATTPMNFTVRLDAANSQDITVDYTVQDVSTEGTDDIVNMNGTLTIPAGATEITLPIDIIADTAYELDETFTITLSNPSSNATLGSNQATGTILNDDAIPVTIDIIDIVPGNDITLDTPSAVFDILIDIDALLQDLDLRNFINDMQIDLYIDDGFNFPVLLTSFNLNFIIDQRSPYRVFVEFPPGYNSGLGLLDLFRFEVTLLNSSGLPIPESSINIVTRPIAEDDLQNFIRLEVTDGVVFTDGAPGQTTTMSFTASLLNADGSGPATLANPLTLNYITVLNTSPFSSPATPDVDFVHVSSSVTIPAGESQATFDIEILGDDEPELIESFYVYLSHDSSEAAMPQRRVVGTINDDDVAADFRTITVSDVQVAEGDTGSTHMQFEVSLDQPANTPVSFTYSTETDIGDHPADLTDYQAITNVSEEFAIGEQSKTVTVLINGDTDPEYDETLLLRITSTSSNSVPNSVGRGTILTDDPLAQVSITDVAQAEGNAGTSTDFVFTVNLSVPLEADLIIDYATQDVTATAGEDYTAATGSITIAQGDTSGTISVTVSGDNDPENDEVFNVVISSSSNAVEFTDATGEGVILNEDSSGWSAEEFITSGSVALLPQLAFGPNGESHVVYKDLVTIRATVSSAPTLWTTPVPLSPASSVSSSYQILRATIDNNDEGVAVWRDNNDLIKSSRLTGGNWVDAPLLGPADVTRQQINMAANPATGEAIIVWNEPANASNNNAASIRSSKYEPINGWQQSTLVETTDGFTFNPDIAMNASGKTIAVFNQQDTGSGLYDIVAYELNGTTWDGPTILDDATNNNLPDKPKIVMNDRGDVAVVWYQGFGSPLARRSIYLNYFNSDTGQWSGAMLVETQNDFDTDQPDVAIDAAGKVFIIWLQRNTNSIHDLMARSYDPTNTTDPWSAIEVLEAEASNAGSNIPIIDQQIVADDEGNAIVVWLQNDVSANVNLRAARYSITDGWQPAELLETNDGDVYGPHLVMDRVSGNAMVVWGRSNTLQANRYTKPIN